MKIVCPKCGEKIVVNGLGRKRLNLAVKIVYDALQGYSTVVAAAEKLGCSRAYIYGVLKDRGLTVKKVRNGSQHNAVKS